MRAWFLSLFRFRDVSLPQEMKAAYWSGPQTARVVYAKPERDEIKPACVHCYGDGDQVAEEIKLERAGQKVRPFKRGTK
jgi:hypothetical protein